MFATPFGTTTQFGRRPRFSLSHFRLSESGSTATPALPFPPCGRPRMRSSRYRLRHLRRFPPLQLEDPEVVLIGEGVVRVRREKPEAKPYIGSSYRQNESLGTLGCRRWWAETSSARSHSGVLLFTSFSAPSAIHAPASRMEWEGPPLKNHLSRGKITIRQSL